MSQEYVPPGMLVEAFNCASCRVYARQQWFHMQGASRADGFGLQHEDANFMISVCEHCDSPTIWHGDDLIFPTTLTAEPPNPDLPPEIASDYDEARAILNRSPRGAAALLRLAIQKLCAHVGQSGKNINSDIKALVAAGLPPKVQEALDSVRVIGNEAVHPGTLDLNDNRDTASQLFRLVNFIAQKMITEPREVEAIYNSLPAEKREAISQRDAGHHGSEP